MEFLKQSTSKGNQPKFIDCKGGWFYKVDSMGYESISEALVSEFLSFVEGVDYIDYHLELYNDNGKQLECCKSKVYNINGENFVSLWKILKVYGDKKELNNLKGKELVDYIVDCVKGGTGVDIRDYLGLLMYIDSIILNEDRHINNINLIEKDGEYRVAPIYDNGLSLLSDVKDYRYGVGLSVLMRNVKSKPFNSDFDKQAKYFDREPLIIDIDGFKKKLELVDSNLDAYVPFKQEGYRRAKEVLLKRLKQTEGTLWIRKEMKG